jgi:hypothetical protein
MQSITTQASMNIVHEGIWAFITLLIAAPSAQPESTLTLGPGITQKCYDCHNLLLMVPLVFQSNHSRSLKSILPGNMCTI